MRSARRLEQAFDWLLGLSVLSWGVLRATSGTDRGTAPADWIIVALHVSVAALLFVRVPVLKRGSLDILAASVPALLVSGWALKVAPTTTRWPAHAEVVFASGGILAILAFVFLGRSFAILPALRQIVVRGPFRCIRHPAYLGELMMILACGLAGMKLSSLVPLLAAIPFVTLRIICEERLLITAPVYRKYTQKVRWRLIPLVW